jgi:hypothetical protein
MAKRALLIFKINGKNYTTKNNLFASWQSQNSMEVRDCQNCHVFDLIFRFFERNDNIYTGFVKTIAIFLEIEKLSCTLGIFWLEL